MFPSKFFGKKYFTGSYFAPVTLLVFETGGENKNGGLRFYPANEPVTNELIERIKRDDEELIAIVSVIGEIIL